VLSIYKFTRLYSAQTVRNEIIWFVKHVIRSILVPHSAAKMYALVNDVPSYPKFLPWCGGAQILEQTPETMKARVDIAYLGLHQSFTTDNLLEQDKHISLRLISGPFSKLTGEWRFTQLGDLGCKIEFELHYAFEGVLEVLVAPVFDRIAATFVDAFVKRADELHL
jgi:ribosome-associated toxin RatA of RatAB toxin-antitoxin module